MGSQRLDALLCSISIQPVNASSQAVFFTWRISPINIIYFHSFKHLKSGSKIGTIIWRLTGYRNIESQPAFYSRLATIFLFFERHLRIIAIPACLLFKLHLDVDIIF
jgi:hypothetical protein